MSGLTGDVSLVLDRDEEHVSIKTGNQTNMLDPSPEDRQFFHSLKQKVEKEAGLRYNSLEVIGFISEIKRDSAGQVMGTVYLVKYFINHTDFVHARVYQPLITETTTSIAVHGESPMPAQVQAVTTGHTFESPFLADWDVSVKLDSS